MANTNTLPLQQRIIIAPASDALVEAHALFFLIQYTALQMQGDEFRVPSNFLATAIRPLADKFNKAANELKPLLNKENNNNANAIMLPAHQRMVIAEAYDVLVEAEAIFFLIQYTALQMQGDEFSVPSNFLATALRPLLTKLEKTTNALQPLLNKEVNNG